LNTNGHREVDEDNEMDQEFNEEEEDDDDENKKDDFD